jgi:oxalate decarboxylase
MLVFASGKISEGNTFLISDWVARMPPAVLSKNFRLREGALRNLPTNRLQIFPADLSASLARDKAAVGGRRVEFSYQHTLETCISQERSLTGLDG